MTSDTIVRILVGVALLLLGKKLFWLFVAAAGFVFGFEMAPRYVDPNAPGLRLIVALGAGLIGAILGLFVQKIAIAVAGFLIGGYAVQELFRVFGREGWGLVAYLVGGILGAVLVLLVFDWALIILSSFAGAMLLVRALSPGPQAATALLVVLFIIGVLIQTGLLRRGDAPDT